MTSPTGNRRIKSGRNRLRHGFTLIELILVMALLSIVLAISSPSLARFFRGRGLEAEAQRFLALTRYGQSRAVTEGLPMVLWIDADQRAYGLYADPSYTEQDARLVRFELEKNIEVEVELPVVNASLRRQLFESEKVGRLPTIRFTPDGYIGEQSPELVLFRERDEDAIWIGQNRQRQIYEIETNQPPYLTR